MSWLSRVRKGIPFLPKRQTTDNLWHKCGKCGTMVFLKEWEDNLRVCPRCEHHDRIGPRPRFEQLFDPAKYELLPAPKCARIRCGSRTASAIPTGSRRRAPRPRAGRAC